MSMDKIELALKARYATVAANPVGQFRYPIGRASAERLGYPSDAMANIPDRIVDRFIGVGNPFSLGTPLSGGNICDIGCGAGFDSQVAAWFAGSEGHVIGVDYSEEMLAVAREALQDHPQDSVRFRWGRAEAIPVENAWADLVISNGVLNLATCKEAAFREIFRILKPGGRLQAADLILVKRLPDDLQNDEFAWSG
jgi:SAM-dependent methyltransferase